MIHYKEKSMETEQMKPCPFCAELIKTEAVKCRYCGSLLTEDKGGGFDTSHWVRIRSGKRIAGVCTGIAHELNAPHIVLPLRLFFIVTLFLSGFGLLLYMVLWILMPGPVDLPGGIVSARTAPEPPGEGFQTVESPGRNIGETLMALLLVTAGVVLVLFKFIKDKSLNFSFMQHPLPILPYGGGEMHSFHWMPGIWAFLIILGLIILFLGTMKFFRVIIGCGLIALGTLFLLIFLPVITGFLFFPGLIILGIILIAVGGIKLFTG